MNINDVVDWFNETRSEVGENEEEIVSVSRAEERVRKMMRIAAMNSEARARLGATIPLRLNFSPHSLYPDQERTIAMGQKGQLPPPPFFNLLPPLPPRAICPVFALKFAPLPPPW